MNLKKWNWAAAIANGASAIGLGIYFLLKKGDVNFNTSLYTDHTTLNADNPNESDIYNTLSATISGTALKILVIVYFAFTTFFHILYATNAFGTGAYERAILNCNNYFRWIEYAISSSIMTFLLAIINGVKDLNTVVFLVVANVAMILCGQVVEAAQGDSPNAKNIRIVGTLIGWILLAGIAFVLLRSFFTALQDGKKSGYKVPTWVYFIIFPLLIWYSLFGLVNLWWAFGNQSLEKYLKVEKAYIFLSFFSKINLGYVVAFGLTRPKAEKEE